MTEEEMAEEYFKSVCKDYNEEKERTGERHYWVGFDIKNAYLDGLKAGRPEWHKVADGNLPKDNRLVLIQVVNGNSTMGIYYVNAWREICNCKELTGVIAWCEIPKYTEE